MADVLLHLARNLSARPNHARVSSGVGPAARTIEGKRSQRVPDEAPRVKLLRPKDDSCMQEPVLEPRFQKEMRDVAKRGEIAGIAVCNQASASQVLPFDCDPEASLIVFARWVLAAADVIRRGPSEQLRPES